MAQTPSQPATLILSIVTAMVTGGGATAIINHWDSVRLDERLEAYESKVHNLERAQDLMLYRLDRVEDMKCQGMSYSSALADKGRKNKFKPLE